MALLGCGVMLGNWAGAPASAVLPAAVIYRIRIEGSTSTPPCCAAAGNTHAPLPSSRIRRALTVSWAVGGFRCGHAPTASPHIERVVESS
jgi:hypothetical protein